MKRLNPFHKSPLSGSARHPAACASRDELGKRVKAEAIVRIDGLLQLLDSRRQGLGAEDLRCDRRAAHIVGLLVGPAEVDPKSPQLAGLVYDAGRIYHRSLKEVICIGKKTPKTPKTP